MKSQMCTRSSNGSLGKGWNVAMLQNVVQDVVDIHLQDC